MAPLGLADVGPCHVPDDSAGSATGRRDPGAPCVAWGSLGGAGIETGYPMRGMASAKRHAPKNGPMSDSPEVTGNYRCPHCGNAELFLGEDQHGYPGDGCQCRRRVCECHVVLRQSFSVQTDGHVVYQAFTGGGRGAEIGTYDRINCGRCGVQVWPAESDGPSCPPADMLTGSNESTGKRVRVGWYPAHHPAPGEFRIKTRRRSSRSHLGGKTA